MYIWTPILLAALSKTWVYGLSLAGIRVGIPPGTRMCLSLVNVVFWLWDGPISPQESY